MDIVVLSHDDVASLLPMADCIELMSGALSALARGEVTNPLRSVVRPEGTRHFFGLMPAYRGGEEPAYALKEVCIFPDNPKRGLDAHQGAVLLHSAEDGRILAIMNASAITAIRTAAVSGLATRLLARDGAAELAIVGTGVQARAHLDAMASAGNFERVRVAGRTRSKAEAFVTEVSPKYPFRMEAAGAVEDAVRGADVIVTATNSAEPVIRREWVKRGSHINAVGSCSPRMRELDTETVVDSAFFVDRRESALNEAGDYLIPASEGAVGPGHIRAELGQVLVGEEPGRGFPEEITIFESQGIAIEDLAAAQFLYRKALETGAGARVPF
jgi:ornithine cyclodeaminase/alanine dehydrogenase-like protein (mu-crystallin family)